MLKRKEKGKRKLQYIILTLTLLTMLYLTQCYDNYSTWNRNIKRKVQTSKNSFDDEMKSRKHVHGLANEIVN